MVGDIGDGLAYLPGRLDVQWVGHDHTVRTDHEQAAPCANAHGIEAIADFAARVNRQADDIGARRLYTVMEKLLEDLSFEAPDLGSSRYVVDEIFVRERLAALVQDEDLSRYIL